MHMLPHRRHLSHHQRSAVQQLINERVPQIVDEKIAPLISELEILRGQAAGAFLNGYAAASDELADVVAFAWSHGYSGVGQSGGAT